MKKIQKIRLAADIIQFGTENNFTKTKIGKKFVNSRFSCLALQALNVEIVSYNFLYSRPELLTIDSIDIDGARGPNKETQLHRALMLDFYAELLEKGDL